jgi:hypothetical protein
MRLIQLKISESEYKCLFSLRTRTQDTRGTLESGEIANLYMHPVVTTVELLQYAKPDGTIDIQRAYDHEGLGTPPIMLEQTRNKEEFVERRQKTIDERRILHRQLNDRGLEIL